MYRAIEDPLKILHERCYFKALLADLNFFIYSIVIVKHAAKLETKLSVT